MAPPDMCRHLSESRKRRRPIIIHYNQDCIWTDQSVAGNLLKKEALAVSYRTLGDVIEPAPRTIGPHQDRVSIQRGHRRLLQCILAQSLLYLYGSPWLPDVWDLAAISFIIQKSKYNIKKAYAACHIYQPASTSLECSQDSSNEVDSADFMVSFGLLILQIEHQQKLELSEEERDDEDGYGMEFALDRYIGELAGDTDAPLQRVLRACLNFTQCVDQIPQLIDKDLKFRVAIFRNILAPLKNWLATTFPALAAQIPPTAISENSSEPKAKRIGDGLAHPVFSERQRPVSALQANINDSGRSRHTMVEGSTPVVHQSTTVDRISIKTGPTRYKPSLTGIDEGSSTDESSPEIMSGALLGTFDTSLSHSR